MVEIFKCHSLYLSRQSLRQFATVLGIEPKPMFCELRLCRLPGAAKLAVHWRLDNNAWRLFIRSLRNLEMHVAVRRIDTGFLYERIGNMKHLQLPASPWSLRRYERILRPAQDSVDTYLLRSDIGNRAVLGDVPEIRDVRLNREALT